MNAQEARKRSEWARKQSEKDRRAMAIDLIQKNIKQSIQIAAFLGQNNAQYPAEHIADCIRDMVLALLKKEGYIVKYFRDPDGLNLRIGW